MKKINLFCISFLLIPVLAFANDGYEARLAAFQDPSLIWGNGVERLIEEAYRMNFQTRIIGGRVMNLRIPFAQNDERDKFTGTKWQILGEGKAEPGFLWEEINLLLESDDFASYAEALSDGKEKVIVFDIPTRSWHVSRDFFDAPRMRSGSYPGLPYRPYVLVSGRGIEEADVYNYIYCVGLIGIDCSGFVWQVLSHLAKAGGVDLGRVLARALGARAGENPAIYAGTSFFNRNGSHIISVSDKIRNLRPGDVILFRSADGGMSHSAIIQSVDFANGVLRYLQSTDEAPSLERGVHDSFVFFDPENLGISLSDPSLVWTQKRFPPFQGETQSGFAGDSERYRAYPEYGGGRVVRIRAVSEAIARLPAR